MIRELDVSGNRFVYDVAGPADAPAMLLLHGLGDGRDSWESVLPALARRHRVHVPDQRGHGDSARPGKYSYELARDDVLAFVDTLGLRDVVLIGHSFGANVAWLPPRNSPAG